MADSPGTPQARLDAATLAVLAPCPVAEVEGFADRGLIERGADGLFERGDVTRVRLLAALVHSGIDADQLGDLARAGRFSLRFAGAVIADPVGHTGRTCGEAAAALGLEWEAVTGVRLALGLPEPAPEDPIREDDLELIGIAATARRHGIPTAVMLRALRMFATSMRSVVEVQRELFRGGVEERMLARGLSHQEMLDAAASVRLELQAAGYRTIFLLLRRFLEEAVYENIVSRLEEALTRSGAAPARSVPPRTIAFLDLSGYTRLTEHAGDERAAEAGQRLVEIASGACARHAGRLVKPLGDGVMLRFDDAAAAVGCCLEIVAALPAAGLPPGRAGIASGPVVTRDGDFYGRTVNLAARLADAAGAGEVLVSAAVAEMAHGAFTFADAGERALKGFDEPVGAWRATAA